LWGRAAHRASGPPERTDHCGRFDLLILEHSSLR
jgi:hypothetical protein